MVLDEGRLARAVVPRRSSVFPPPSAVLVECPAGPEANAPAMSQGVDLSGKPSP